MTSRSRPNSSRPSRPKPNRSSRVNPNHPSPARAATAAPLVLLLALLLAFSLGGCAIMNRDNTPLLNEVEEHLWPESTGARIAVFPVVFPAGVVAVVADAVIVHPASVVDDAFSDTSDALWDDWDFDEHYVTECTTIPWRVVLSPVFFSFDFVARALFDIPDRAETERRQAEKQAAEAVRADAEAHREMRRIAWIESVSELLDEAEARLDAGRPADAIVRIAAARFLQSGNRGAAAPEGTAPLLARSRFLLLRAASESGRNDLIDPAWAPLLRGGEHESETEAILGAMRWSDDEATRWTAYRFDLARRSSLRDGEELIRHALGDDSALVRHAALACVERFIDEGERAPAGELERLLPDLEERAAGDEDPIVRTFARQLAAKIRAGAER